MGWGGGGGGGGGGEVPQQHSRVHVSHQGVLKRQYVHGVTRMLGWNQGVGPSFCLRRSPREAFIGQKKHEF